MGFRGSPSQSDRSVPHRPLVPGVAAALVRGRTSGVLGGNIDGARYERVDPTPETIRRGGLAGSQVVLRPRPREHRLSLSETKLLACFMGSECVGRAHPCNPYQNMGPPLRAAFGIRWVFVSTSKDTVDVG